jgi:hypothetical protein
MPLQVASVPAEAYPLVQRAVLKVSASRGATGRTLSVADPSRLNTALPHPLYLIDARDTLDITHLSKARLVSWRFLVMSETTPLAVIELHCDSGGNLSYAKTIVGPFVAAIQQAVAAAEGLGEVVRGTYELRALIMPSIYLQALWLKDLVGSNDTVISFKPTSPGTFQVLRNAAALPPSGGGLTGTSSQPPSIESFFAQARQTASRKLAFDNAPQRGTSAGASGGSVQPRRSTDMTTDYEMPTSNVPAGGSVSGPSGGGVPPPPTPPTATRSYASTPIRLLGGGGGGGGAGPAGPASGASGGNPFVINRQDLIKNYANMVARTWTDPSYLQLLLTSPPQTLDQAGIPTIPGAVIRILQIKLTGIGKIEEIVEKWIDGIRTGQYDLFIPIKPDGISVNPAGGGDTNCCCTPCCCCT